jgi:hypothetical protein
LLPSFSQKHLPHSSNVSTCPTLADTDNTTWALHNNKTKNTNCQPQAENMHFLSIFSGDKVVLFYNLQFSLFL